jgi:hypothetical protein
MAALRRGLAEYGYLEGKNFTLVPSWGDANLDRLGEERDTKALTSPRCTPFAMPMVHRA